MSSWAVIFPGQGSQFPGMARFLFEEFQLARETFEEASDTLKIDFKNLLFESSESELAQTANTQPALLLSAVTTWNVLSETADLKQVKYAAGHSAGEYGALVAGGAISFSEAIQAVRKRGEYMQSAVPLGQGGMSAILGLSPSQVEELCHWALKEMNEPELVLEPANFNCTGQVVISGHLKALNWVQSNYKAEAISQGPKRLKIVPLKVSAPFHCQLMKPAEEKMKPILENMKFKDSRIPVIQNISAKPARLASELRSGLISQMAQPVRWEESMRFLGNQGVRHFIECGPGRVLGGLAKKIESHFEVHSVNSMEDIKELEGQL